MPLTLLRRIVRRKGGLRLLRSEHTDHLDLSTASRLGSRTRFGQVPPDEASVDEDRSAAIFSYQRGDDVVAELAFSCSRLNEDLLRVVKVPSDSDLSVGEFGDGFGAATATSSQQAPVFCLAQART